MMRQSRWGMARYRQWQHEWQQTPLYLKYLFLSSIAVSGVVVVQHIEIMPLTGRRRLMFLSRATEAKLGNQAYHAILQQSTPLPPSHPMSQAVNRIGHKIQWLTNSTKKENENEQDSLLQWKFHVIDSPEPNAFCLPGGKVFVCSGLFKVLRNENELAAVLFHEAAHGLARHGAEKISFSFLIYGLVTILFPDAGHWSDLIVKLAIDLPFSRKLEIEADAIGLRLMAQACYDPRDSIRMNQSLDQMLKHQSVPKYISTHPPSHERINALKTQLDDAMQLYRLNGCMEKKNTFQSLIQSL